jgi:plasmid stabilization system protein ParE
VTSADAPIPALDEVWRAGAGELAEHIRARVQQRNRLDAEIGRLIAKVENRGAKATYGYGSTLAFLQDLTHLPFAAAKKVLVRALAVNPSHQLDGSVIPARAPLTGTVAADGVIGPGQVDAIVAVMSAIPATATDEDRAGAEKILVDLARDAGPREIRRAGDRLLDTLDPDGRAPKDPNPLHPARELHFQQHRDGTASLKGHVDPITYAQIRSVIDPLAKPHPATPDERRDTRSLAERQGDALAEASTLAMSSLELPTHGGDRTHIVVTLNYDDLRTGAGAACLDLAGTITAAEARLLACDAHIIPMVLGSDSEPLDVGRIHRFVTPALRRALTVRDRGCTFPGCPRTAKHTQAHHIIEWAHGGSTSLRNMTLLCARHHRLIHHSDWEVRMATDGKPEFIPPDYLDPLRQPRRYTMCDTKPLAA